MKKILALILAGVMLLSLVACGEEAKSTAGDDNATATVENGEAKTDGATVGQTLLADFKALSSKSAQEIADGVLKNGIIQFMAMAMPVEEGLLNGFDNTEIKGFKEGVMFGPAIGSIPFIGYVFVLEDGADVEGFKKTLDEAANLRWNICVEADEKIVESEGNTVFFLMCPASFEQEGGEAGDVGGMELAPEDQVPAAEGEMEGEGEVEAPAEGEETPEEETDTPAAPVDEVPVANEEGEVVEENPVIEDEEEVA